MSDQQQKAPKSILKKTKKVTKESPEETNNTPAIVWNEENLNETSKDKGTRMKIDEVDTPYAYPGDYSISADSEGSEEGTKSRGEAIKNLSQNTPQGTDLEALSAKLEFQKKRQEHGFDLVENPERSEAKRKAFLEKRKQHYGEGQKWKEMKKKEDDTNVGVK